MTRLSRPPARARSDGCLRLDLDRARGSDVADERLPERPGRARGCGDCVRDGSRLRARASRGGADLSPEGETLAQPRPESRKGKPRPNHPTTPGYSASALGAPCVCIALARRPDSARLIDTQARTAFEAAGGYAVDARVSRVLKGLGFQVWPSPVLHRIVSYCIVLYSLGQYRRYRQC